VDVVIPAEVARTVAKQLTKLPYRKVAQLIQVLLTAPAAPAAPAPTDEKKA